MRSTGRRWNSKGRSNRVGAPASTASTSSRYSASTATTGGSARDKAAESPAYERNDPMDGTGEMHDEYKRAWARYL
ncbi:hypothetical protein FRB98_003608, partial [Tulasnella sp. 332]